MTSLGDSVTKDLLLDRESRSGKSVNKWADGYIRELEEHMHRIEDDVCRDCDIDRLPRLSANNFLNGYREGIERMLRFLRGEN